MMMSEKDFLKSRVLSWRRKVYSDGKIAVQTAVPPGFSLPRHLWTKLNHFRTGQGQCAANLAR